MESKRDTDAKLKLNHSARGRLLCRGVAEQKAARTCSKFCAFDRRHTAGANSARRALSVIIDAMNNLAGRDWQTSIRTAIIVQLQNRSLALSVCDSVGRGFVPIEKLLRGIN
jgi:hypothetical protein